MRITVPGVAGSPPPPTGILVGIGVFGVVVGAATAWIADASRDASLWAVPIGVLLITGGFLGSLLANHLGRSGIVLLTRRAQGWAALTARAGRWLMVLAAAGTLAVSVAFLLFTERAHLAVWLLVAVGVAGLIDGIRKLTHPVGVYLEPGSVTVVSPRGTVAHAWDELASVHLAHRGLTITGARGQAVLGYGETASDPAVLAAVVEGYRARPGSRSELADDRFVERLRRGEL